MGYMDDLERMQNEQNKLRPYVNRITLLETTLSAIRLMAESLPDSPQKAAILDQVELTEPHGTYKI